MNTFLEKLQKLPSAAEMGEWDNAAIAFGIPENMLMENAGRAIAREIEANYGPFQGRVATLFMGNGNNGGDAACIARHIQDRGGQAIVYCLKPLEKFIGAPLWHAKLAQANGAIFTIFDPGSVAADFLRAFARAYGNLPDLLIDGLLGTGFNGMLKPEMAHIISIFNDVSALLKCPVIAVDIPSGLFSASGLPCPLAIKASLTVTLQAPKPGLVLPQAKPFTGELVCRSIGIPQAALKSCKSETLMLDGHSLENLPKAPANSFKNIYGHLFVIGGAHGYAGAAHLACAAALRAGCGLVTAMAPALCLAQVKAGWAEIMTQAMGGFDEWPEELADGCAEMLKAASALVIGPGMGRSAKAGRFLECLLAMQNRPPAVIDADALCHIAINPHLWKYIGENDILTPHPGEAAILLGCAGKEVQKDRVAALSGLCDLSPATVVLKGAATLISQKGRQRIVCPYDIPQLAIGGAGDVLSGCIGAIAASQVYADFNPMEKAALGVISHAMAGLILARRYPERGATASQLADALANVGEFVNNQEKMPGVTPWP